MDLGNESRTLFYSGPVVRRVRGDTGFSSWIDLTATLLDNYCKLDLKIVGQAFTTLSSYPDARHQASRWLSEEAIDVSSTSVLVLGVFRADLSQANTFVPPSICSI